MVLSVHGEMLTVTDKVVRWWKKYFEDRLNSTNTYSVVGFPIVGTEVTEVVKQLRGSSAPGWDEIFPEYLKALDVVGLSWVTLLCNSAWTTIFKKGDKRVCSNYK